MCARSGTHRHGMRSHSSGGRTRKESLNFSSPWRCQSHRNAAQCLGLAVPPPPCPDASHRPHLPPHHAPAEHQLIHCDSPELFRALSDHSWESCGEGAPRWGSVGVHGCGSGAERPGGAYKTGALGGAGSGESLPAAAAMVTGSGGRRLLLVLLAAVALLGAPGRGQPRGEGADLRDGGVRQNSFAPHPGAGIGFWGARSVRLSFLLAIPSSALPPLLFPLFPGALSSPAAAVGPPSPFVGTVNRRGAGAGWGHDRYPLSGAAP